MYILVVFRLSCKMSGEAYMRLSVERIYQKKSQREHILFSPDTYIGSVQLNLEVSWQFSVSIPCFPSSLPLQAMWVYDEILKF